MRRRGRYRTTFWVSACLVRCPRANTELVGTAILDHCKIHLSSYKVPASVHFVKEIPRTGSGKIIRFKLKKSLAAPIDKAS